MCQVRICVCMSVLVSLYVIAFSGLGACVWSYVRTCVCVFACVKSRCRVRSVLFACACVHMSWKRQFVCVIACVFVRKCQVWVTRCAHMARGGGVPLKKQWGIATDLLGLWPRAHHCDCKLNNNINSLCVCVFLSVCVRVLWALLHGTESSLV